MSASSSRSRRARFLLFLLWVVNRSGLEEGRARPLVVRKLELDDARREESWDVKARVVEEEISFVVDLGLRMP
jgi:hypothetical protein